MKRLFALALFLCACEVRETIGLTPDGGAGNQGWAELRLGDRTDQVDLLFVVDNSPSMATKQSELRRQFPELVRQLQELRPSPSGGSYHIGVVTTDLGAGGFMLGGGQCHPGGDGGRLQAVGAAAAGSCQPPVGAPFIDYDQRTGATNLPDGQDLATTFACMASVGDRGCGFEQPLEAAWQALHGPDAASFLRDDAVLAVVFLTDEDDCSAPPDTALFDPASAAFGPLLSYRCTAAGVQCGTPPSRLPMAPTGELTDCVPATGGGLLYDVQRYIDYFRKPASQGGAKPNPRDVLLFAIDAPSEPFQLILANPNPEPPGPYTECAGPLSQACAQVLQHSCMDPDLPERFGDPAVRLNAVVDAVADHGERSICATSYGPTVDSLARTIVSYQNGNGCLTGYLRTPLDPRCEVDDAVPAPAGSQVQAIPSCAASDGSKPCWRIETSPACPVVTDPESKDQQHLQLTIDRDTPLPTGAATYARCVVVTG